MAGNGRTKRLYESANLIDASIRRAPVVQKRAFCIRLYNAWINSLSESDVNKIVNQLVIQGHEFKAGSE